MNIEQATVLMRALKGAPLSCLVFMLMYRRPLGAKVLAQRTAYHINTVDVALATLAGLGLAVKTGRFESWQLTDKGRQLPLFDMDDYPAVDDPEIIESEKFRLDAGEQFQLPAEVGAIESEKFRLDEDDQPQPLTVGAGESEKFRLEGESSPQPLGPPAVIESEKFRLDEPKAGAEGQNSGIESEFFRLDDPLPGSHGTHDVLKHDDVLNTDSTESLEHHHESGTCAHEEVSEGERETIIQAAAEIFRGDGHSPPSANRLATRLVNDYGAERVKRQVDLFPARCEYLKSTPAGLKTASGTFTDSVYFDRPPAPQPKEKTWYTQDEFNDLIDH